MRTTPGPHAQLSAIERRRRWKLAVQGGGILLIVVGVTLFVPGILLAVGSRGAVYVGGTVVGLAEKTEGSFDTTNEDALSFLQEEGERRSHSVRCDL